MNTTNLAYIVRVLGLVPIPRKDQIELAIVKGWKCIVKKGEFCVGDLAIYLAIGSVPDFEDPHFSFLKAKHNRIKTIKIGGVVSQGLLGPMSWLTDRGVDDLSKLKEGDDVALAMGVTKFIPLEESAQYEKDTRGGGPKHTPFPDYVPKTDATRLQHNPDQFFAEIADKEVIITRKEDGCSATFIAKDGRFLVCGRNYVWEEAEPACAHYFRIAEQHNLAKMATLGRNLAIQGEICGPKINGNRLKLTNTVFSVFDVFDIDTQQYLPFNDLCALCATLEIAHVPVLYRGPVAGAVPAQTVDAYLELSERTMYGPGLHAEGIVVKTDPVGEFGMRAAFKVISNKYLIKHDL